jgi:hypothetical protein
MNVVSPDRTDQQVQLPRSADYDTALKFLSFVLDGAADGFVEFQFFGPGRRPKRVGQGAYLNLPIRHEQLTNEVLSRSGQQMIAVGVAPRYRIPDKGRAGRNQDVLQVGCVWANLDNSRSRGGAIDVLGRIKDFPLRPSVAVNSGYGYHVYFAFHSPLRAGELLVWNELMRGLRAALSTNTGADLCEVMRLPGTFNIKEAHPVPCEVWEEQSSWTRYSVDEVRKAIEDSPGYVTPVAMSITLETLKQRGVGVGLLDAVVTGRGGPGVGYDGEPERDAWIASALLEKGFSEGEVKAIFRAHPNGCGSNWGRKRDGERYLDQILLRAGARLSGGKEHAEGAGQDGELQANTLPPGYELKDGAVWLRPPAFDADKKPPKAVMVSSSFIRIAEIRENIDTGEISLSIAFEYLGRIRFVPLLRSEMADSRKLVAALSGAGAPVTSVNARLVTAYLAAYEHAFASGIARKKVTSRFGRGRSGGQFFFPGLSFGIEFYPSSSGDAALYGAYSSRRGSLGGWLEVMRALADDNLMIPQVAVLASLFP